MGHAQSGVGEVPQSPGIFPHFPSVLEPAVLYMTTVLIILYSKLWSTQKALLYSHMLYGEIPMTALKSHLHSLTMVSQVSFSWTDPTFDAGCMLLNNIESFLLLCAQWQGRIDTTIVMLSQTERNSAMGESLINNAIFKYKCEQRKYFQREYWDRCELFYSHTDILL